MLYKRLSILFDVLFHKNGTFWSQFPTHMEKFFEYIPFKLLNFDKVMKHSLFICRAASDIFLDRKHL